MKITRIEIIVKGVHRNVGYFDYNSSTYFTKRDKKNIMRSYYGFGVSTPILNYMEDEKIHNITVICDGKQYKSTLFKYYMHGFEHRDGKDIQIILPMSYFQTEDGEYKQVETQEKHLFKGLYSFKPKQEQRTMENYN